MSFFSSLIVLTLTFAPIFFGNYANSNISYSLLAKGNINVPQKYKYYRDINFFIISQLLQSQAEDNQFEIENITKMIKKAQAYFDKCSIFLRLNGIYRLDAPTWFGEYESFSFNDGNLTDWEKLFFNLSLPKGTNILYVDSLNWTLEGNGTMGLSYPKFMLDHYFENDQIQKAFYVNKMLGSVVIGRYRAHWTLAHELGHSILNLHHSGGKDDIMSAMIESDLQFDEYHFMVSMRRPSFTDQSCKRVYSSPLLTQ